MVITYGWTIWNKKNLLPKIIFGLNEVIDKEDEAIFVFDNCEDGSVEEFYRLKKFLKVEPKIFINHKDQFEISCNNLILRKGVGDFIALFQDDIVLRDKGFKGKLEAVKNKYKNLGLIGGRTGFELSGDRTYPEQCYYRVSNWEHLEKQYGERLEEGESKTRTILNRGPLMFSRELINEVGYLDEYYYPQVWDDADYCLRARLDFNKQNVVMGCEVESQLSWGATHNKQTQLNYNKLPRQNWEKLMDRWSDRLKKEYENFTIE